MACELASAATTREKEEPRSEWFTVDVVAHTNLADCASQNAQVSGPSQKYLPIRVAGQAGSPAAPEAAWPCYQTGQFLLLAMAGGVELLQSRG